MPFFSFLKVRSLLHWACLPASIAMLLFSTTIVPAVPAPTGLWEFDNSKDLLKASIGASLQLRGQQLAIPGIGTGDGAVRLGVGSHYACAHGIAPNASGFMVNRYSILFDFRIEKLGIWHCFFQTDPSNQSDGDCFIRSSDGAFGVAQTGYSSSHSKTGAWQRLLVTVDNSLGIYRIYLDGELVLNGAAQPVDGRFALEPTILFFADDDGEDGPIDITRLAIYDVCLSGAEAAELGGVPQGGTTNQAPIVTSTTSGLKQATTGQKVEFRISATDPDNDGVQIRMDWGDGSELSPWSILVPASQEIVFSHTFKQPGIFHLRALPQDQWGTLGQWTDIQDIQVAGDAIVEYLTPPYLQNVRPDGITIMWELNYPVEAEVEFGLSIDSASHAPCTRSPSGAGSQIYKCVLNRLEPGTTYRYRTRVAGHEGLGGLFTTAPQGSPNFAFSVWSDSQGSNHGAYDADPLEPTKSMLRHMTTNGISIGISAGDMAESGGSYSDTRSFYLDRVAGILGSIIPWYVAWGNHDGGPDTVIRKFADFPSGNRPGFNPGYGSYSFDYAGCHFIALDDASSASDILNWLETDLKSEANRNAKFTFLFVHVPPYCDVWLDGDEFLRTKLVPLMETHGVDVCFSGHTHEYERGFKNGVYYCVTGGGSWLDIPETQVADWPFITVGGCNDIPGVVRPRPDAGGGLVNEYVRVEVNGDSFTASMIGFSPDGKEIGVLDHFTGFRNASGHAPNAPVVTGPQVIDVFASNALVLRCSAFSDPDAGNSLLQAVWRLSLTTNADNVDSIVWEGITQNLECSIDTGKLSPGQMLFATVKHVASDGLSSPFSTPLAIRLIPDPLYFENFEHVQEFNLPQGWTTDYHTYVDIDSWNPNDPRSNTYLTWTVVSSARLASVMGANRVNVAEAVQGNSVYAESDHRAGFQVQHLTTPDFDLGTATNIVVSFRSNYIQNQDSLGALEYSIDGGAGWFPVVYLIDEQDTIRDATGQIDATATFGRVDPDDVPTVTGTSAAGGTYGEHILCKPFPSLADFISPRVNDNATESKRIERYRLLHADAQPRVRFRFTLTGSASWFWGIDDFALFGTSAEAPRITRVSIVDNAVELEWTSAPLPCQVQARSRLGDGVWENLGDPLPSSRHSISLPLSGSSNFYRIRLVP